MKLIHTIIVLILFLLGINTLGQNNIIFDEFNWSSEIQYTDSWSVNWVDFNNDGWDDLFIPTYNINQENTLYQNNGGEYFTKIKNLTPVIDKCIAHYPEGVYIIKIEFEGKVFLEKILKRD